MHCFVPALHKYTEEQNANIGPMKVLKQVTFYNIVYLLCAGHFFSYVLLFKEMLYSPSGL